MAVGHVRPVGQWRERRLSDSASAQNRFRWRRKCPSARRSQTGNPGVHSVLVCGHRALLVSCGCGGLERHTLQKMSHQTPNLAAAAHEASTASQSSRRAQKALSETTPASHLPPIMHGQSVRPQRPQGTQTNSTKAPAFIDTMSGLLAGSDRGSDEIPKIQAIATRSCLITKHPVSIGWIWGETGASDRRVRCIGGI